MKAGCWSYLSEDNAKMGYDNHLAEHQAHDFSEQDATRASFSSTTHVAKYKQSFAELEEERRHQRRTREAREGREEAKIKKLRAQREAAAAPSLTSPAG